MNYRNTVIKNTDFQSFILDDEKIVGTLLKIPCILTTFLASSNIDELLTAIGLQRHKEKLDMTFEDFLELDSMKLKESRLSQHDIRRIVAGIVTYKAKRGLLPPVVDNMIDELSVPVKM
jgi:hypothetical protein